MKLIKINNCWVLQFNRENGCIVYEYDIKKYFYVKYIKPLLIKVRKMTRSSRFKIASWWEGE